jgi:hypothetical protein
VGFGKQFMAALYPTKTGNMVMHLNEICNQQPVMTLSSVNIFFKQCNFSSIIGKIKDLN